MAKKKVKKKTSKKKAAKKMVCIQPKKADNPKDVNKLTGTKPVPRVVTQVLGYGSKLSELSFANDKLTTKAQKLAAQLVKFAEQIGSTLDADTQKGIKAKIKADAKAEREAKAKAKAEVREARRVEIDAKKADREASKLAKAEAKLAKRWAKIEKMKAEIAALEAEVN